jgi:hypothetical protein
MTAPAPHPLALGEQQAALAHRQAEQAASRHTPPSLPSPSSAPSSEKRSAAESPSGSRSGDALSHIASPARGG